MSPKVEDVRVVCSLNALNSSKLPSGFEISDINSEVRRINFYTSCAFEGCDIFDKDGRIYIVSDGKQAHTLYDISTSIPQICGRIRDQKEEYRSGIEHIFNSTRYSEDDYETYVKSAVSDYVKLLTGQEEIDRLYDKGLAHTINVHSDYLYRDKNDRVHADRNKLYVDLMQAKYMYDYSSFAMMDLLYKKAGNANRPVFEKIEKLYSKKPVRMVFKDMFIEYCKFKESDDDYTKEIELLEERYDFIRDAYNILGKSEVERVKYKVSSIRRELIKLKPIYTDNTKVTECLKIHFRQNGVYSISGIISRLNKIYVEFQITGKWGTLRATRL